ncbi:hypothetical protein ABZ338_29925 [Streptomyces albidoflavus]|uniref:hypothetical protein n=1 Tax=Streptomyces albidoflavus TaxID=1886 RepID=UPI000527C713|nr:hypothetical protein [Streptomyces albidoflavus]
MSPTPDVTGVHLLGSVPLADADTVFRAVSRHLGPYLSRIPDGETGDRLLWAPWQKAVFEASPAFRPVGVEDPAYGNGPTSFARNSGELNTETLGELGYARAALHSYERLTELRRSGQVPPDVRFQVDLPTQAAPIALLIEPTARAVVEPVYHQALLAELEEILARIPHEDLAIQWDVAVEIAFLESSGRMLGGWWGPQDDLFEQITERLAVLGDTVPADVELGYHLCYGNSHGKPFAEPKDSSLLVEVASDLQARLRRDLDFLHLPVPRDRDDEAYFAPLAELSLPQSADLYLGLLHLHNGLEGARKRIAAAGSVLPRFGIATHCGMGRMDPATVEDLLALHRSVLEDSRV